MRKQEVKLHDYLIYAISLNHRFNCTAFSKSSKKEAYEWFKEIYVPAHFFASDRAHIVVANIIEL